MIEIEGLPEGWKAVAYRVPKGNIEFVFIENVVREAKPQDKKCLIVEKIKPRRIVLEETEEKYLGCQTLYIDGTEIMIMTDKVWREVKETDIPLTNEVNMGASQGDGDEPKLELSVDRYSTAKRPTLPASMRRNTQTGQPVWTRRKIENEYFYWLPTTTPDWNIPKAEYSFTEFKEEA